jgi:hypothetical protein
LEVVALQRRHGALAVHAHPSSWWLQDDQFITNIASELALHLVADGGLDGMAVMGYNAVHRSYQALWFHLLDSGAVIPAFAETDQCHDNGALCRADSAHLNCLALGGNTDPAHIVATARLGRNVCTTGPLLNLSVDGVGIGEICETAGGRSHTVTVDLQPAPGEDGLSRLELLGRGGTVLARIGPCAGGRYRCQIGGSDLSGYVVARAVGCNDDPDNPVQRDIRMAAISNPVYLRPRGFDVRAATTAYQLRIDSSSEWAGGCVQFETAAGDVIESGQARAGDVIGIDLPASARVRLVRDDDERMFYIAMENTAVQPLLRYLWAGEFRAEHPECVGGQVPAACWRLPAMREALAAAAFTV